MLTVVMLLYLVLGAFQSSVLMLGVVPWAGSFVAAVLAAAFLVMGYLRLLPRRLGVAGALALGTLGAIGLVADTGWRYGILAAFWVVLLVIVGALLVSRRPHGLRGRGRLFLGYAFFLAGAFIYFLLEASRPAVVQGIQLAGLALPMLVAVDALLVLGPLYCLLTSAWLPSGPVMAISLLLALGNGLQIAGRAIPVPALMWIGIVVAFPLLLLLPLLLGRMPEAEYRTA